MIEALASRLIGQPLLDIKLIGQSHLSDGHLHHHPNLDFVYLVVGDLVIEMASLRQGESLRMSIVPDVQTTIELDPGEQPTVTSIAPLVLRRYYSDNRLSKLTLFSPTPVDGNIHCEAAALTLDEHQVIFLDPTYTFGIRVGGEEQEGIWRENRWQPHPPEAVVWVA